MTATCGDVGKCEDPSARELCITSNMYSALYALIWSMNECSFVHSLSPTHVHVTSAYWTHSADRSPRRPHMDSTRGSKADTDSPGEDIDVCREFAVPRAEGIHCKVHSGPDQGSKLSETAFPIAASGHRFPG
jgi:hypothetical protein